MPLFHEHRSKASQCDQSSRIVMRHAVFFPNVAMDSSYNRSSVTLKVCTRSHLRVTSKGTFKKHRPESIVSLSDLGSNSQPSSVFPRSQWPRSWRPYAALLSGFCGMANSWYTLPTSPNLTLHRERCAWTMMQLTTDRTAGA